MAAVRRDGVALRYASTRLQADMDVVLAAVIHLKFVSAELKGGDEGVFFAPWQL